MSAAEHVIFGTGAAGLATFDALRRRGITPRMINRSGHAHLPDGVEVIGGDAGDPEFATTAASGAKVIYQTLNPPYPEWAARFPGLQRSVLAAAQAHGARLVSMENVYMYGKPNGRPLTEDRPHDAHTKKGRIRSAMAVELLAAHNLGDVEVAIGRASDYFGPRGGAQSNLGDRLFPAAIAGRTATVLGDLDQPHTYTFIPDIGEGLAVLGEHPDAPGRAWHLPNDPDTRTTRQLVEMVYRRLGYPRAKVKPLPPFLLRAIGVVNPTMREIVEMQYQFDEPFIVDSTPITHLLGAHATLISEALELTAQSYLFTSGANAFLVSEQPSERSLHARMHSPHELSGRHPTSVRPFHYPTEGPIVTTKAGPRSALAPRNATLNPLRWSRRRGALISGTALALMVPLAVFGNFVVITGLTHAGDPIATAAAIAASPALWISGITAMFIVAILDVVAAAGTTALFLTVNRPLSIAAGILRTVFAALFAIAIGQLIVAFTALEDPPQVLAAIESFTTMWQQALGLFGIYLLVIGYLTIRSRFIPAILGILLGIAGLGYIADLIGLLTTDGFTPVFGLFGFVGETAMIFWLLIRGRRLSSN